MTQVIDIIRRELDVSMALTGVRTIAEIGPHLLGLGTETVATAYGPHQDNLFRVAGGLG